MRSFVVSALVLFCLPQAQAADVSPYTLPETEVFPLHSAKTGADYNIYVSRPSAPPASGETYPAIYMLDPDYSFAIVERVVRHFNERRNLPPMVLVGVASAGGAEDRHVYKTARTRDYTPTFVSTGGYGAEYQKGSGGAPKFIDFIATELAPVIEKKYRASSDDRTIIGHSYGGLFASYALLTHPDVFKRYVIVSPSLWYDDRLAFRLEEKQAKEDEPLEAHVFLSVGAIEQRLMADDLTELKTRLDARKNADLKVDIKIFEDETHNSVFPAAVTRGLLKVFDAFPALAPPPEPQTTTSSN